MKKITALLLALMMLISMVGTVFAETVATEPAETELPVYKLKNVKMSGKLIEGEIELVSGKKVEGQSMFVRVIIYTPNNTYVSVNAPVYSDNTFELQSNIKVEHISFILQGRNADKSYTRYDATGLDAQ